MNALTVTRSHRTTGIFTFLVASAVFIFSPVPLRAQEPEPQPARLYLAAPASSIQVGDTLQIEVRVDPADQPVSVVGVFLQFDPARLRFESGTVNIAVFNNNLFTSTPRRSETGIIAFSAGSVTALSQANTLVATLTFTGVSTGMTDLAFITKSPRDTLTQDNALADLPTVTEGISAFILPQPAARLFIAPGIRSGALGENLTVEIRMDAQGLPVRIVEAYVSYDPTQLRLVSGGVNRNLFDHLLMNSEPQTATPGVVALRAASAAAVRDDNVLVGVLTFQSLAEGMVPLRFLTTPPSRSRIVDETLSEIHVITSSGMVAVNQPIFSRLSFFPATQTAAPGDQVQLEVRLDPIGTPARLLEAYVDYDPFRLRFDGGSVNDSLFDNPSGTTDPTETERGLLSFLASSGENLSSPDVLVETLNFTVLSEEEATVRFFGQSPRETQVRDESLNRIPTVTSSATINAQNVEVSRLVFEPQIQVVQPGDTVIARVSLEARNAARFVRAYVHYDPTRLRFVLGNLNTATFNNAKYSSLPALLEPGTVAFGAGADQPVSGRANVATLQFQAMRTGVSDLQFLVASPNKTTVQSDGFVDLSYSAEEGWVTVNQAPRLLFTFTEGPEDWRFQQTTAFDVPSHGHVPGDPGVLQVQGVSSANTFGYWESPPVDSGSSSASAVFSSVLSLASALNPGDFLEADFFVRSPVSDPARVPQFRLRATAENLQQSAVMTVESARDGAESPGASGRSYALFFPAQPDTRRFTLAFDYLNFNPADDPLGALELDWVEVKAHAASETATRTPIATYNFDTDAEGWTIVSTGQYASPAFEWQPGALTLSPNSTLNVFGYWYSPDNAVTVEEGRMYMATFEVESNIDASERERVPTFRCRVNETGLHTSAYIAVESRAGAILSPAAGNPQSYVVYFIPPRSMKPSGLILSFDLAHFDPTDASDAVLKLNRVLVESTAAPW